MKQVLTVEQRYEQLKTTIEEINLLRACAQQIDGFVANTAKNNVAVIPSQQTQTSVLSFLSATIGEKINELNKQTAPKRANRKKGGGVKALVKEITDKEVVREVAEVTQ